MMAGFHHIEVWVADIEEASVEWGWLLSRLGFTLTSTWTQGQTWTGGGAYLTLTTSPNTTAETHDRRRPGVNHLAFKAGSPASVDTIMTDAAEHGWRPLYHDRYPHAGGPDHYAGWLENSAGFKAEVVAELSAVNAATSG
ncbi:Glyoxalase/Bleomycin resistance protein/Dioxygenase superfamily protein [Brevibacterium linens ATCC 9172]|uniref:Glyoxalase/Bleomycin resistance protein/Dioxygenase superfamily protein n=2 Tax=Brevibacterium linens TaxID=1703 RepID=A0A2H1J696_BRELN|nr:Glyoxalase/Bleomycin resistance protein/Dioxygenase superfamily protein [Brevibacterium linens ATCC 9172]